ncbi:Ras family [Plasmodiophora brassicae]|uniref:Uncharacterized protein n=1 Tax=Plasmodiophora brassicae TaxID=37360 RepID=A0A3P3YCZ0_PLABS|nr:unnamed protein product [Plasmodiophora brassicae]
MESYKLTAVGDGTVGKTCMLITYTTNTFPQDYTPTMFDSYETDVNVNGVKTHVILTDTAGQEDFDQLRPLSYNSTDCFILCFSVASHPSFENITQRWIPELKMHAPKVPIVLVATKVDCRSQPHLKLISEAEGRALARRIEAYDYIETSAKTMTGLDQVFLSAIRAARNPKAKARRCNIL